MTFVLEFFGTVIQVVGAVDAADLSFFFGPHLRGTANAPEPAAMSIQFATVGGMREVRVHDHEGTLLRRWAFHGIGGIPPVLPPFAVMARRYAVVQAAVLTKGDTVVALIGGVGSPRNSVALALGERGWRMVSGQYLVVDRATGRTMPYQLPIELRGGALDFARAVGLADAPERDRRTVASLLAGSCVAVRPERLVRTVAVGESLGPARLVRLCTTGARQSRLDETDFSPSVWPPDAAPVFSAAPRMRLLLPEADGAEEAADLFDERLAEPAPKGGAPCPGEARTKREHPAGSITLASIRPAPRSSTRPSSAGSSGPRLAAVTT